MKNPPDLKHRSFSAGGSLATHCIQLVDHLLPSVGHSDLSVLVLKGHLLIEESMNDLLAELLGIEQIPADYPLEFSQKYSLIRAHVCSRHLGPNADLLDSIKELNNLRNRTAHYLLGKGDLDERIRCLVTKHCGRMDKKSQIAGVLGGHFVAAIRDIIVFLDELRRAVISTKIQSS